MRSATPTESPYSTADGGVEQGAHGELLRVGGVYARLFALRADGYQDTGAAGGPVTSVAAS
ncbi:hypothetical protein [Streptomyces fumanus]|uniref:hypothetical protein n=1 Tax=Streptomyces fumanus TaxID=67302 RepID=UPI0033F7B42B